MNTLRHVINFRLSIGNNRSSKLPVTSKKIDIHEFNQCHRPLVCELLNSYINKNDEEEVSALNIFRADYNEKDKNHLINLLTIIKRRQYYWSDHLNNECRVDYYEQFGSQALKALVLNLEYQRFPSENKNM